MNILWITPGFAADENDRSCIPPLQLLARAMVRLGVDLNIVTLEYPFRSEPYHWHGANVFPCNGQNRRWLKGRTIWRAMLHCHAVLDEKPCAAIHSFWLGWASGVGERISVRREVPHFTSLMGQDVLPQNRKFMIGLSAERASRLIAVSDFQHKIFEENTGLRAAHVVPWGVDEEEVPVTLPPERSLDVLGAGSMVRVKNWELWLRVVALAVQNRPSLRAEIVGGGVERAKMEQLSRHLGLEHNVRIAGELPRPAVLAKMLEAKVFLHTAHFESFGYVLAEAAMSGCHIVGTPVGAMPQFGETATSAGDLSVLLLEALDKPLGGRQPFVPCTMRQTAEAYLRLYAQSAMLGL